jgi:hypothetical protein
MKTFSRKGAKPSRKGAKRLVIPLCASGFFFVPLRETA